MQRKKWEFSQAAVEFALILPLLLLIIFGLLEMGRLVFVYTAVLNASREAARYGAATGDVSGLPQYTDCDGMRASAVRVGFLSNITTSDVTVWFDQGPGSTITLTCDDVQHHPEAITTGSRVLVRVSVHYTPMVPLVPLSPLDITSTNSRTLLGSINIEGTAPPPPTLPPYAITLTATKTPTTTATPTSTATPTKTSTITPTETVTLVPTHTPTWMYSPTVSLTPTISATPTVTLTSTERPTVTATATERPTVTTTATYIPDCNKLTVSNNYTPSSKSWTVTLTNGNTFPLGITNVFVKWSGATLTSLKYNSITISASPTWDAATSTWTLSFSDPIGLYAIPASSSGTFEFDFSSKPDNTITGTVDAGGCHKTIFP